MIFYAVFLIKIVKNFIRHVIVTSSYLYNNL